MLEFKNRINLKIVFLVILILLISSCSGERIKDINSKAFSGVGSYIIKYNDYLYFYKYIANSMELYRRDLKNGSEEHIDTLTNPNTGHWGVVKMFLIDTRLYYGKSTDKTDVAAIYSIDVNDPHLQFEGSINELFDDHTNEMFVTKEFKRFELGDNIFALANGNVYKLDAEASERVAENVSGICVDGEKIYYSIYVDDRNSGGIMCYNISDGTNTEIVSDTVIREYNKTTVYGGGCAVRNIVSDGKSLYFLGTPDTSEILRYDFGGNEVRGLTHRAYPGLFRMRDDKLYYIDFQLELSCVNTDGTDEKKIIENEWVFGFNISGNSLYYYKQIDDGYPVGLIEMDLETGEKRIISITR